MSKIPDEAVEAAAKEFATIADPYGEWDKQMKGYQRVYLDRAQRILEAAAPYLICIDKGQGSE